jgi:hypothetical protein
MGITSTTHFCSECLLRNRHRRRQARRRIYVPMLTSRRGSGGVTPYDDTLTQGNRHGVSVLFQPTCAVRDQED